MPIRLQYNTIRLFSSTVRRGEIGKESSTRIINDDPASKAADETRPTHGQGKGALTQEVSNKNLDHMVKGQTVSIHSYDVVQNIRLIMMVIIRQRRSMRPIRSGKDV